MNMGRAYLRYTALNADSSPGEPTEGVGIESGLRHDGNLQPGSSRSPPSRNLRGGAARTGTATAVSAPARSNRLP